jgi:hypothetical protein
VSIIRSLPPLHMQPLVTVWCCVGCDLQPCSVVTAVVCVGVCICGFCNVWVCVCMCGFCNMWVCVCVFCKVWKCVCMGFVMCGFVCMCGFCNVCVCVCIYVCVL